MAILSTFATKNARTLVRVNLGNFPPNTKATLTCFMYSQLKLENENFCFRLPLCYIPQYLFGNGESAGTEEIE